MSFDELAATGQAAVLQGKHQAESPSGTNGARWGMSVILRIPEPAKEQLALWTSQALARAGDQHWATGMPDRVHITVKALKPRRAIDAKNPVARSASRALLTAASTIAPLRFRPVRLLLSPGSVMLGLSTLDGNADELLRKFEHILDDGSKGETAGSHRLWYLNLVHLAGPINGPQSLVEWTQATSVLTLPAFECSSAALVDWDFDGRGMAPVTLTDVALRSPRFDSDKGA